MSESCFMTDSHGEEPSPRLLRKVFSPLPAQVLSTHSQPDWIQFFSTCQAVQGTPSTLYSTHATPRPCSPVCGLPVLDVSLPPLSGLPVAAPVHPQQKGRTAPPLSHTTFIFRVPSSFFSKMFAAAGGQCSFLSLFAFSAALFSLAETGASHTLTNPPETESRFFLFCFSKCPVSSFY